MDLYNITQVIAKMEVRKTVFYSVTPNLKTLSRIAQRTYRNLSANPLMLKYKRGNNEQHV